MPSAQIWATCLRSLALVSHARPQELMSEHDELYQGIEAYRFLLEVVCGLHSPIVGETEVFGQFKIFSEHYLKHAPQSAAFIQRVLSDAKRIRTKHLTGLGTQSYGSWIRKALTAQSVHILGGGQLVQEILPYVKKAEGREVHIHVRSPGKINYHAGPVRSLKAAHPKSGALIVAAPMSPTEIQAWWGASAHPEQLFDLRDNSHSDPLHLSESRFHLQDIFRQIEAAKNRLLPQVSRAREAISARTEELKKFAQIRPQGWDDLCA